MQTIKTPRRLATLVAAAAVTAGLASASPAAAFECSASAVRGTVLGQTGLEPVVAGTGGGCENKVASLASLPAPLAGVAAAQTQLDGPAAVPTQQKATALSGVEGLSIGALRTLPISLPEPQIPAGLDAIEVPLPANLSLLGLPSSINVNALPAALDKIPVRQLPDLPLAAVDSLRSAVSAQCLSGLLNRVGASAVQGLRGLGESLPTDEPVDRVVTLLGEQTIPLTGLDMSKVELPGGLSFADPVTGAALRAAVEQALSGLPPVVLPAAMGRVETQPDQQVNEGDSMEQRALRMTVSMAGQQVADLVLGIARVATGGLSCAEAAAAPVIEGSGPVAKPVEPASQLAVSCAQASVTLVNVIDQNTHVTLIGAADKKLIGKRVRIVQTWNGKRVATTKVGRSGFFRTKAPMPREAIRYTNDARYMAVIGDEESLPLKLHRRMRFSSLESHGRKVTLKGRIFGPMTDEVIEIRQRVSCTKDIVVKRIRPNRDGSWKVTLDAPKRAKAATYRATTSVRNPGSARSFPTFTLPGYVSL